VASKLHCTVRARNSPCGLPSRLKIRSRNPTEAIWKMTVGEVDQAPVVIVSKRKFGKWEPAYPVCIRAVGDVITEIADYYACPWLLPMAESVRLFLAGGCRSGDTQ
jgi:hypothetical protein